ncbi:TPA: hypothetical protein ACGOYX_001905, partial [Streptococcus suis]
LTLMSYETPIISLNVKTNELRFIACPDYWSHTTLRHMKEFLRQNGIDIRTKKELLKMYQNTK